MKVQRWTGPAMMEPHDNGGWVAYGDYLTLLNKHEANKEAFRLLLNEYAAMQQKFGKFSNYPVGTMNKVGKSNELYEKLFELAGFTKP